jgi:hypothetical protein
MNIMRVTSISAAVGLTGYIMYQGSIGQRAKRNEELYSSNMKTNKENYLSIRFFVRGLPLVSLTYKEDI